MGIATLKYLRILNRCAKNELCNKRLKSPQKQKENNN